MTEVIKRDRKEYFKIYHEKNKDERNTQNAKRREEKRDEINEGHKKYYYENKELRATYIECECGKKFQLRDKARHAKSKYHIDNNKS